MVNVVNTARREAILDAVVPVVGHFGLKKCSMNELAQAAGVSKQGLYLHFDSKEALLSEAMTRYFETGLGLMREALETPGRSLQCRLTDALDAWFGRHFEHFNPASLEVVEPGGAGTSYVDEVKQAVCRLLETTIAAANEASGHTCTPAELARVLFQFGLTWKEGHPSRAALKESFALCVRACFPEAQR